MAVLRINIKISSEPVAFEARGFNAYSKYDKYVIKGLTKFIDPPKLPWNDRYV